MKIKKYSKKKNGKYELILDKGEPLELYEDTILKYQLLLKSNIQSDLASILKYDKSCEVYYIALKYLKVKLRSKIEVEKYLIDQDYSKEDILAVLEKLEKQGYLNDLSYAKSFLHHKLITTSNGPFKIKNELLKKGVSSAIIDEVLDQYDLETQLEKIRKIVSKMIRSNRNKSNQVLRKKIISDLICQGFQKENIEEIIKEVGFHNDRAIANKEKEKLYLKLSKKYQAEELEFQVRKRMIQKGFHNE